jgi:hypothetical protein
VNSPSSQWRKKGIIHGPAIDHGMTVRPRPILTFAAVLDLNLLSFLGVLFFLVHFLFFISPVDFRSGLKLNVDPLFLQLIQCPPPYIKICSRFFLVPQISGFGKFPWLFLSRVMGMVSVGWLAGSKIPAHFGTTYRRKGVALLGIIVEGVVGTLEILITFHNRRSVGTRSKMNNFARKDLRHILHIVFQVAVKQTLVGVAAVLCEAEDENKS